MSSDNATRGQPPKRTFASPSTVTRTCGKCGTSRQSRGGGFQFVAGRGRVWCNACCLKPKQGVV